jgi:hypothetical protein
MVVLPSAAKMVVRVRVLGEEMLALVLPAWLWRVLVLEEGGMQRPVLPTRKAAALQRKEKCNVSSPI